MGVELRTGTIRPTRREDYCTKITAVAPRGECPLWGKFLDCVTAEDKDLQSYLQRVAGYCLTGYTSEHVMFFLYGTGANGKSVFIGTLAGILGDYATTAPMEMFTVSNTDRHPTELAMLRGARLVTAQETEQGRRWAEAKIKALTGGDRISARFMRQDFFEFTPQFKLLIAGNHKPGLRGVDEAIRRRIHLIPFKVTIPPDERDPELPETLKAEWPGILAWAIAGCLEWQRIGLAPPAAVRNATDAYLASEDALAQWLDECCARDPQYAERSSALFANWKRWAETAGEFAGSQKRFSQMLEDRGFERGLNGAGQAIFRGLALKPQDPDLGI
ncbi:MAG: phage/plasmid primase, P4 family [Stellaceae bacterium]